MTEHICVNKLNIPLIKFTDSLGIVQGGLCYCGGQLFSDNHVDVNSPDFKVVCRRPNCKRKYLFSTLIWGNQWLEKSAEYQKSGNGLTDNEMSSITELQYLLVKLAAESAELSHATLKAIEFGINTPHPDGESVIDKIRTEFNDILGVVRKLNDIGFLITEEPAAIAAKVNKVEQMMQVAVDRNLLNYSRIKSKSRYLVVKNRMYVHAIMKDIDIGDQSNQNKIINFVAECPERLDCLKYCTDFVRQTFPSLQKTIEYNESSDDASRRLVIKIICTKQNANDFLSMQEQVIDFCSHLNTFFIRPYMHIDIFVVVS